MQAAAPKGLPLQASLFKRQALYKASPARGCGVERRLRRRKRDGAGAAVAEHKRASARAVRCGHRKPDGGCAARRRRRGALPPCGGDILQSLAEPCPVLRRGRCLHRPGNLAMPQTPGGGRNRPPYIAAGAWRQRINASLSSGPPAGRCKHRPLRRGQRRSTTVIRPPCLPPGSSVRLPYIAGRAFTPAGGLAAARKGIGKARRRTPQSADADSSPYRGAFRAAVPPKPPLQGEVDAPQGADGGVHCRLAAEISRKPGRALPCVS